MKWICRSWKCSSSHEWTSEFDRFNTKEEAIEHGRMFVRLMRYGETARDFEVYPEYETEEEFEEYYGVYDEEYYGVYDQV